MSKFQIRRNTEVSYVYRLPVEDVVADQFAVGVKGKLPSGTFQMAMVDGKFQLILKVQLTEERGDE